MLGKFFGKIKQGLAKTRAAMAERIAAVVPAGTRLDEDAIDEIEAILIQADVGWETAGEIIDELLERIRDIRSSEKPFYQKIRDIYKLSIEYNPQAEQTREFFQVVQNKLHWAITGKTAAEIITD